MKKEQIESIKDVTYEQRRLFLRAFNYDVIGDYVIKPLERGWVAVLDRYTGEPINIMNIAIMPSPVKDEVILLNDNPLSIASYLEEFEGKV